MLAIERRILEVVNVPAIRARMINGSALASNEPMQVRACERAIIASGLAKCCFENCATATNQSEISRSPDTR